MRLLDHLRTGRDVAPLEQDAWQRGFTDLPGWTRRKPVVVQIATTVAGCGFGLALGSTWWERVLFAILLSVGAFLLGLVGLWLWRCAAAVRVQRNEARDYARSLEAYAREYAEWQARRASDDLLPAIARPLEDLQTRSDGYGDRHLDRVRNSMNVISHNLRAVSRPEPPPEKPARPELPGN